jgi:hypothetical protein
MGRPKNTPDAYAPFISEFTFLTNPVTILQATEFLQEIELELPSAMVWKARITLFDSQGDVLEGLAFLNNPNRALQFKFGWDNPAQGQLPVWQGTIVTYTPTFTAEGTSLLLEVTGTSTVASALNKRSDGWPANMTASQIFTAIAARQMDENGNAAPWAVVDEDGNPTVEPTQDPLEAYTYRDDTDLSFIQERLLPQACNAKKEAFLFFIVNNVAHFHSYKFLPANATYPITADYLFTADAMGEVLEFAPTDNVVVAALLGGGNAEYSAVNSTGGSPAAVTTDTTSGVQGQQTTSASKLTIVGDAGAKRLIAPNTLHAKKYIPSRTPAELQRRAAANWSTLSNFTYTAHLLVRGTHAVQPYDRVRVRRILKDGTDHYLSGIFLVANVTHNFGSGGWTTSMVLIREGAVNTGADAVVSDKIVATTVTAATPSAATQTSTPTTSPNVLTGQIQIPVTVQTPGR